MNLFANRILGFRQVLYRPPSDPPGFRHSRTVRSTARCVLAFRYLSVLPASSGMIETWKRSRPARRHASSEMVLDVWHRYAINSGRPDTEESPNYSRNANANQVALEKSVSNRAAARDVGNRRSSAGRRERRSGCSSGSCRRG